ncbi:hypothetical protein HDU97_005927, partial [Phlyctochytrium planicorne]
MSPKQNQQPSPTSSLDRLNNTATSQPPTPPEIPLFIVKKKGLAGAWQSTAEFLGFRDKEEEAFRQAHYSTNLRAGAYGSVGKEEEEDEEEDMIAGGSGRVGVKVVDTEQVQAHLKRRRRKRLLASCTICLGILLIIFAIAFPIIVILYIPQWISKAFATPSASSTTSVSYLHPLHLLDPTLNATIFQSRFPKPNIPPESANNGANHSSSYQNGVIGGFELQVNLYQTGYKVPLGVPLTALGTSMWRLAMPQAFVQAVDASVAVKVDGAGTGNKREDANWMPLLEAVIPEDVPIRGGKLILESNLITFRVPEYVGAPLPKRLEGKAWPLGVSLIQSIIKCFITGNEALGPPVRLAADAVNFILGATNLPIKNVDLWYDYEVGSLLVKNGFTLPALLNSTSKMLNTNTTTSGSSKAATSTSSMSLTFSNLTYLSDKTTLLNATAEITLPFPSPVTFSFQDLSLRLNLTTTQLASATITSFQTTAGSTLIKLLAKLQTSWTVSPPKDVINTIASLLGKELGKWPDDVYVGVDGLNVGGGGLEMGWIREALGAVDVRVPLRDVYESILRPLLSKVLNVEVPKSKTGDPSSTTTTGPSGP